ncbi:hypothetical protein SAMN05192544_10824 [Paraburkholderia hospita]|nr:hypothetical protein SAMN05192544_10824 [Paraburkholderia hospita]
MSVVYAKFGVPGTVPPNAAIWELCWTPGGQDARRPGGQEAICIINLNAPLLG